MENTYYAFYAAAGCCGTGCSYLSGVARSKNLLGPWEKYQKNPILTNTEDWICPGHGTPVEKNGKFYFLYHGYDKQTTAYTGREGLLQEFTFTADGWIEFIKTNTPFESLKKTNFTDKFSGSKIDQTWQWNVFQDVHKRQKGGNLQLKAIATSTGAFLAQKTLSGNYNATTTVRTNKTNSTAGIAAIGDERNVVSVLLNGNTIKVVQVKDGKETEIASETIEPSKKVQLQLQVRNAYDITFAYSTNGSSFKTINTKPVSGAYLPPWDRAVRVGLISKGETNQQASFDRFELVNL